MVGWERKGKVLGRVLLLLEVGLLVVELLLLLGVEVRWSLLLPLRRTCTPRVSTALVMGSKLELPP